MNNIRSIVATFIFCFPTFAYCDAETSLFEGSWQLEEVGDSITLVNPPFSAAKMFQIHCAILAPVDAWFSIRDDNDQLIDEFSEGSTALVEATTLHIEQIAGGTVSSCSWEVLEESPTLKQEITWLALPATNRAVLIAAFQEPMRFVFSFEEPLECENGRLSLMVDGVVIENILGAPQILEPGNSFVGKGATASVFLEGFCPASPPSFFTGRFRIQRIEPLD